MPTTTTMHLLVRTYEAAISKATGRSYGVPERQTQDLYRVVLTFGKDKGSGEMFRGQALLDWLTRECIEFSHAVSGDDVRFWSALGPSGLLRFLNAGKPSLGQPGGRTGYVRGPSVTADGGGGYPEFRPAPPPHDLLKPEELSAAVGKLLTDLEMKEPVAKGRKE